MAKLIGIPSTIEKAPDFARKLHRAVYYRVSIEQKEQQGNLDAQEQQQTNSFKKSALDMSIFSEMVTGLNLR